MSYIFFPIPTPVFPVLSPLAWSVHKKPILSSRAVTAVTGRETQLATAAYPRFAFTLTYGGDSWLRDETQNILPGPNALGHTELQQLSGLYLACLGSYGEFYYSDPDDSSRLNQGVGVGNGTLIDFLVFYQWGNGPFTPPLLLPVGGIGILNTVYFNGVAQSPTIYHIDPTNTTIVFNVAPSSGVVITADFSFFFRCRFLDDHMDYSEWAQNLWETKEVRFESVKP